MSRDRQYVQDIIDSALQIAQYLDGLTFEQFEQDTLRQDAVLRRLEIIGEAVKRLSTEFRDKHPQIPWKLMAGMRDVLIHDYDKVIIRRIWNTANNDLPDLVTQLQAILDE